MGHAAKDNNMNKYSPSTSSLKQGYLHIKRERTTSMFAKPWQQAYFILRRDPFIMEEYKDASLKTRKQLHFIGTIRHVGRIRTSKSQQFAFEVVMKEKTPLLFACENQILMDEWIDAFQGVMDTVGDCSDKHSRSSPAVISFHSSLDRKGSQHDAYNVSIVESTLSQLNELVGEYYFMMTSSRMSLLTVADLSELLSWPIGSVTYYTNRPNLDQVILVMGRTCHFGNGKLIFESSHHDQIIKCIEMYQLKSSKSRNSAGRSGCSSSSISNSGSNSLSDKSPLSVSCDDDEQPVFYNPVSDEKVSKALKLLQEEKRRSFSFPDVRDCENPRENNHKKLQQAEPFFNNNNSPPYAAINDGSPALPKKLFKDTSECDIPSVFPEIIPDEGYILPNQQDVSAFRTQTLLDKVNGKLQQQQPFEISSPSPNGSDNENEISTSYLQIIDSDENIDDPVAKKLLDDLTSQLENPVQNNPSNYFNSRKKNTKNSSLVNNSDQSPKDSPKSLRKYNKDYRRSSEPVKGENTKIKNTKKANSVDCTESSEMSSGSINSPQIVSTPLHQTPLGHIGYNNTNAFPKQQSISQGNHSTLAKPDQHSSHPFGKWESYFLKRPNNNLNRNIPLSQSFNFPQSNKVLNSKKALNNFSDTNFKSPELDRTMKPKPMKDCNKNSLISEKDEPPPVPERQSPKQLQNHHQHKLRREPELREEDEDDCMLDTTEEGNTERRGSCSVDTSMQNDVNSIENINNNDKKNNFLHPPPLPPKSKPLSCTKSAPIPARENDGDYDNKEMLTRCSSLNSNCISTDKLTEISFNGPIITKNDRSLSDVTLGLHINDTTDSEIPPEVPCRLPVHPLEKMKQLSASQRNLFSKRPFLLSR